MKTIIGIVLVVIVLAFWKHLLYGIVGAIVFWVIGSLFGDSWGAIGLIAGFLSGIAGQYNSAQRQDNKTNHDANKSESLPTLISTRSPVAASLTPPVKWALTVAAGAFFLYFLSHNNDTTDGHLTETTTPATPSAPRLHDAGKPPLTYSKHSGGVPTTSGKASKIIVEMPPATQGGAPTAAQVRRCLRKNRQLEATLSEAKNAQPGPDFLEALEDYNAWCVFPSKDDVLFSQVRAEIKRSPEPVGSHISLSRHSHSGITPQDVQHTQALLKRLGYDPGPIDGKMGSRTRTALEAFQTDHAISPSGTLTRSLLETIETVAKTQQGDRENEEGSLIERIY